MSPFIAPFSIIMPLNNVPASTLNEYQTLHFVRWVSKKSADHPRKLSVWGSRVKVRSAAGLVFTENGPPKDRG